MVPRFPSAVHLTLIATLVLALAGPGTRASAAAAAAGGLREYEAKAIFVYNVLKFVEFPSAGLAPSAPLTVVVLSAAPLPEFSAALSGKTVKGHPIVVQGHATLEKLGAPQVVFIAADASKQLRDVIKAMQGQPVLTVAEQATDGADLAGIAMGISDTRLTFEVNLDATETAGLQVSSGLLSLAKTVRGGKRRAER